MKARLTFCGLWSLLAIMFLVAGCIDKPKTEEKDGDVDIPSSAKLSDEDYAKYLQTTDPNFQKEMKNVETSMKKEMGVQTRTAPPPPPGWNLEEALMKNDNRPKIYRWIDEKKELHITPEKPPKGTKLLGWRYADRDAPTVLPDQEKQAASGQSHEATAASSVPPGTQPGATPVPGASPGTPQQDNSGSANPSPDTPSNPPSGDE